MIPLKETLGAIVILLKEIRKDVRVATIVILTILIGVCLYIIFALNAQNSKIVAFYEQKLELCQNERIKDIKASVIDYKQIIVKTDSLIGKAKRKK